MADKKPFGETGFGKFLSKAGGIIPDVAGIAIKVVQGDIKGAIEDAKTALSGNPSPEAQAMLNELQSQRMQWEQEMAKMNLADRADARSREVAIVSSGRKNVTQNVLAYLGVAAFVAMVFFILSKGLGQMTTETSFIVGNLSGLLGAIAKDIFGYYFGSSQGSADKSRTIAAKDATIEQMSKE